jgi:hypothetical protein
MNETLACSACGRSLHVPDGLRGQAVKCPACHHTFTAPGDGSGSVPPSEPPFEDVPPRTPARPTETTAYDGRPRLSDHDDPYHDAPHGRRDYEKPGKVQAIAVMTLIGGILALLWGLICAATCVLLVWPGTYYSFVLGIMAIVKASALLGDRARNQGPPQAVAVMQIVNIVNGDVVNLVLGIVTLVFLGDPEVKDYFRR